MNVTELTCIVCPVGCHLEVKEIKGADENVSYQVSGNTCKRGEKYGIDEVTNPTRMVTSTVKIEGAHLRRMPVKTSAPIPKGEIFTCMSALEHVTLTAPVTCGDKVIENFLGLEIDIVATRSLERVLIN